MSGQVILWHVACQKIHCVMCANPSLSTSQPHNLHRSTNGGVLPSALNNVKIYSNIYAFVAVDKTNNQVVTSWGNDAYGGVPHPVTHAVLAVYSTYYTFAGLKTDGTVYAWGGSADTGLEVPAGLVDVVSIASTSKAFAALTRAGGVRVWGHVDFGGGQPSTPLTNVHAIYATKSAFAAVKLTTLIAWVSAPCTTHACRYFCETCQMLESCPNLPASLPPTPTFCHEG